MQDSDSGSTSHSTCNRDLPFTSYDLSGDCRRCNNSDDPESILVGRNLFDRLLDYPEKSVHIAE